MNIICKFEWNVALVKKKKKKGNKNKQMNFSNVLEDRNICVVFH